jgi:hypothetical protein
MSKVIWRRSFAAEVSMKIVRVGKMLVLVGGATPANLELLTYSTSLDWLRKVAAPHFAQLLKDEAV